MPAPDQWRFYWPYPRPKDFSEVTTDLDHAQERLDRVPVFPAYQGRHEHPSASEAFTLTAWTKWVDSTLTTFYKEEDWTDLRLEIITSGYHSGVANLIAFGLEVDANWQVEIGRFFYNVPAAPQHIQASTVRLWSNIYTSGAAFYPTTPLPAGQHTAELIISNITATGNFNVDLNDFAYITITECVPPPSR